MRPPIRAFIAIDLDERVKRELARVQERLKAAEADIKWNEPKDMHLTLKFLGDIQPEVLDDIEAAMAVTAAAFTPFHMDIGALGAFPDITNPKILWAGVTKRANLLAEITARIDEELKTLELHNEDRGFSPHITLGRAHTAAHSRQLMELLKNTHAPAGLSQKVERIALFRSELFPKGAVYHLLHSVKLGGADA